MTIFIFTAQLMGMFVLSLCLTAISEIFWHKYLFHSKNNLFKKFITRLWDYDINEHTKHHKLCFNTMHDTIIPTEKYDVQKLSNVYAAAVIALAIQCFIIFCLNAGLIFYIISFFTIYGLFTFWYLFEDHFHKGMHKPEYYETHIKNTWQNKWFEYAKRMHTLHHHFPDINFGFVFFPLGDLFFRTYRHTETACIKTRKN